MTHRLRRRAAKIFGAMIGAAVVPALLFAQPASAAPSSGPEVVTADGTVTGTCVGVPVPVKLRWYFPASTPTGLLWLQHGFARSAQNLDGLAKAYAAQGLLVASTSLDSLSVTGCSVADNIADNTTFTASMASVFGQSTRPGSALSRSLAAADGTVHSAVAMPQRMVFSGHSAGGEFVLDAADALRRTDPDGYRRLGGLVLLDPVNSFLGSNFQTSVTALSRARLPIRVISTPPSTSNAFGQGVSRLQKDTEQPFLGVQLTTGVHIDAEGDSTDIIGIASQLATPRPRNVRVIRTLSPRWADDLITEEHTAAFYPGGSYYQLLLRTDTVTTLPVG